MIISVNLVVVVFVSVFVMSLTLSLTLKKLYNDVKLLIQEVNKHAKLKSYAVVTARFKKFKKDINWFVYLRYDRKNKTNLTSEEYIKRLHSNTRLIKCSFNVKVKRNKKDRWYLDVIQNKRYNHTATLAVAHSALRKLVTIAEIRESITSLTKFKITSDQILTYLWLNNNKKNSLFIQYNIYNAKIYLQRQILNVLSFIQTLL